jgi:predicted ATP-grasp superfamily ATP-dependent carboligase
MRVLLGDATSYKSAVLARFLARRHPDVEVHSCDHRAASSLLHSRFVRRHHVLRNSPAAGSAFVDELLALLRQERIDLLLPVNSREMDLLLPRRAEAGPALAWCGDAAAYEQLHRKDRLAELARACGVRVPAAYADTAALRLPAVAKPVASSSAKGVRYLRSEADRERFLSGGWPEGHVVQEYVEGVGVGWSCLAVEGRPVVGYGHRRLAEWPVSGGSSVYREAYRDPRLQPIAERLLAATRWSGLCMFEFKLTPSGELILLEANPRVWGSIHQGLAEGVDYLAPLLGREPAAVPATSPVRTFFGPFVHLSLLVSLLRGRPGPLLTFLRRLPSNRADVSLLVDPRAWLASLARLA